MLSFKEGLLERAYHEPIVLETADAIYNITVGPYHNKEVSEGPKLSKNESNRGSCLECNVYSMDGMLLQHHQALDPFTIMCSGSKFINQ